MMMSRKPILKIVALVLALVQLVTAWDTSAWAYSKPVMPSPARSWSLNKISIPESLGRINVRSAAPSGKTLLVIEDAHAVPSAQKSIWKLIEAIRASYGAFALHLEGLNDASNLAFEHSFPDRDWLRKKIEADVDAQNISGGAAALISSDLLVPQAAESQELYLKAVELYQSAIKKQGAVLARLERAHEIISKSKQKSYSAEALKWDRFISEDSLEALPLILQFSEKVLSERFPHLEAVRRQFQMQNHLKRPAIIQFWQRSLGSLAKKASRTEDQLALLSLQKEVRAGRLSVPQSAQKLESILPADLREKMNGLEKRLCALALNAEKEWQEIKTAELAAEYKQFLIQKVSTYFTKAAQHLLLNQTLRVGLLERLVRLELSWADWQKVKAMNLESSDWQVFKDFYAVQFKREEKMQKHIAASFRSSETVVFVSGGFHKQGLEQIAKKQGWNFAVITPSIVSLEGADRYSELMQGNVGWRAHMKVVNGRVNLQKAYWSYLLQSYAKDHPAQVYDLLLSWRKRLILRLADLKQLNQAVEIAEPLHGWLADFMSEPTRQRFRDQWRSHLKSPTAAQAVSPAMTQSPFLIPMDQALPVHLLVQPVDGERKIANPIGASTITEGVWDQAVQAVARDHFFAEKEKKIIRAWKWVRSSFLFESLVSKGLDAWIQKNLVLLPREYRIYWVGMQKVFALSFSAFMGIGFLFLFDDRFEHFRQGFVTGTIAAVFGIGVYWMGRALSSVAELYDFFAAHRYEVENTAREIESREQGPFLQSSELNLKRNTVRSEMRNQSGDKSYINYDQTKWLELFRERGSISGIAAFLGMSLNNVRYHLGKNGLRALEKYTRSLEDFLERQTLAKFFIKAGGDIDRTVRLIQEQLYETERQKITGDLVKQKVSKYQFAEDESIQSDLKMRQLIVENLIRSKGRVYEAALFLYQNDPEYDPGVSIHKTKWRPYALESMSNRYGIWEDPEFIKRIGSTLVKKAEVNLALIDPSPLADSDSDVTPELKVLLNWKAAPDVPQWFFNYLGKGKMNWFPIEVALQGGFVVPPMLPMSFDAAGKEGAPRLVFQGFQVSLTQIDWGQTPVPDRLVREEMEEDWKQVSLRIKEIEKKRVTQTLLEQAALMQALTASHPVSRPRTRFLTRDHIIVKLSERRQNGLSNEPLVLQNLKSSVESEPSLYNAAVKWNQKHPENWIVLPSSVKSIDRAIEGPLNSRNNNYEGAHRDKFRGLRVLLEETVKQKKPLESQPLLVEFAEEIVKQIPFSIKKELGMQAAQQSWSRQILAIMEASAHELPQAEEGRTLEHVFFKKIHVEFAPQFKKLKASSVGISLNQTPEDSATELGEFIADERIVNSDINWNGLVDQFYQSLRNKKIKHVSLVRKRQIAADLRAKIEKLSLTIPALIYLNGPWSAMGLVSSENNPMELIAFTTLPGDALKRGLESILSQDFPGVKVKVINVAQEAKEEQYFEWILFHEEESLILVGESQPQSERKVRAAFSRNADWINQELIESAMESAMEEVSRQILSARGGRSESRVALSLLDGRIDHEEEIHLDSNQKALVEGYLSGTFPADHESFRLVEQENRLRYQVDDQWRDIQGGDVLVFRPKRGTAKMFRQDTGISLRGVYVFQVKDDLIRYWGLKNDPNFKIKGKTQSSLGWWSKSELSEAGVHGISNYRQAFDINMNILEQNGKVSRKSRRESIILSPDYFDFFVIRKTNRSEARQSLLNHPLLRQMISRELNGESTYFMTIYESRLKRPDHSKAGSKYWLYDDDKIALSVNNYADDILKGGYYPLTRFEIKQYRKALRSQNPDYYTPEEVPFYLERREHYGLLNDPDSLQAQNPGLYKAALRQGYEWKNKTWARSELRLSADEVQVEIRPLKKGKSVTEVLSRSYGFVDLMEAAYGNGNGSVFELKRINSNDPNTVVIAAADSENKLVGYFVARPFKSVSSKKFLNFGLTSHDLGEVPAKQAYYVHSTNIHPDYQRSTLLWKMWNIFRAELNRRGVTHVLMHVEKGGRVEKAWLARGAVVVESDQSSGDMNLLRMPINRHARSEAREKLKKGWKGPFAGRHFEAKSWQEIEAMLLRAANAKQLDVLYVDLDNTTFSTRGWHGSEGQIQFLIQRLTEKFSSEKNARSMAARLVFPFVDKMHAWMKKNGYFEPASDLDIGFYQDLQKKGVRIVAVTARPEKIRAETMATTAAIFGEGAITEWLFTDGAGKEKLKAIQKHLQSAGIAKDHALLVDDFHENVEAVDSLISTIHLKDIYADEKHLSVEKYIARIRAVSAQKWLRLEYALNALVAARDEEHRRQVRERVRPELTAAMNQGLDQAVQEIEEFLDRSNLTWEEIRSPALRSEARNLSSAQSPNTIVIARSQYQRSFWVRWYEKLGMRNLKNQFAHLMLSHPLYATGRVHSMMLYQLLHESKWNYELQHWVFGLGESVALFVVYDILLRRGAPTWAWWIALPLFIYISYRLVVDFYAVVNQHYLRARIDAVLEKMRVRDEKKHLKIGSQSQSKSQRSESRVWKLNELGLSLQPGKIDLALLSEALIEVGAQPTDRIFVPKNFELMVPSRFFDGAGDVRELRFAVVEADAEGSLREHYEYVRVSYADQRFNLATNGSDPEAFLDYANTNVVYLRGYGPNEIGFSGANEDETLLEMKFMPNRRADFLAVKPFRWGDGILLSVDQFAGVTSGSLYGRSEARSETRNEKNDLLLAYEVLKDFYARDPVLQYVYGTDLEDSYEFAREAIEHPIQRVAIVGDAMASLPVLLSAVGKEVYFVEMNPDKVRNQLTLAERVRVLMEEEGLEPNVIRGISSEIGKIDFKSEGIEEKSFDLVTLADLLGGGAVGDVKEWVESLQKFLKPRNSYVLLNEEELFLYETPLTFKKHFMRAFPDAALVSDRAYAGSYDALASQITPGLVPRATNRLYKIDGASHDRRIAKKVQFHRTLIWGSLLWGAAELMSWYFGFPFIFSLYSWINSFYWGDFAMGSLITSGLIASATGAIADYYTQLISDYPAYRYHVKKRFAAFMGVRFLTGVVAFAANLYWVDQFISPLLRAAISGFVGVSFSSLISVYFNGYWNRRGVDEMQKQGDIDQEKADELRASYSPRSQWSKDLKGVWGRLPVLLTQHHIAQDVVPEYLRIPTIFTLGLFMQLFRNYMVNSQKPSFDLKTYLRVNLSVVGLIFIFGGASALSIVAASIALIGITIGYYALTALKKEAFEGVLKHLDEPEDFVIFILNNPKKESNFPQLRVTVSKKHAEIEGSPYEGYEFELTRDHGHVIGRGAFYLDHTKQELIVDEFYPIGNKINRAQEEGFARQGIGRAMVHWLMAETRALDYRFRNSSGTMNEKLIRLYAEYLDRAEPRQTEPGKLWVIEGFPRADFTAPEIKILSQPKRSEMRVVIDELAWLKRSEFEDDLFAEWATLDPSLIRTQPLNLTREQDHFVTPIFNGFRLYDYEFAAQRTDLSEPSQDSRLSPVPPAAVLPDWMKSEAGKIKEVRIQGKDWMIRADNFPTIEPEMLLVPEFPVELGLHDPAAVESLLLFHNNTGIRGYINSWGVAAIPQLHDHLYFVKTPLESSLDMWGPDSLTHVGEGVKMGVLPSWFATATYFEGTNENRLAKWVARHAQQLRDAGIPYHAFFYPGKVVFILRNNLEHALWEAEARLFQGHFVHSLFHAGLGFLPKQVGDYLKRSTREELQMRLINKIYQPKDVAEKLLRELVRSEMRDSKLIAWGKVLEQAVNAADDGEVGKDGNGSSALGLGLAKVLRDRVSKFGHENKQLAFAKILEDISRETPSVIDMPRLIEDLVSKWSVSGMSVQTEHINLRPISSETVVLAATAYVLSKNMHARMKSPYADFVIPQADLNALKELIEIHNGQGHLRYPLSIQTVFSLLLAPFYHDHRDFRKLAHESLFLPDSEDKAVAFALSLFGAGSHLSADSDGEHDLQNMLPKIAYLLNFLAYSPVEVSDRGRAMIEKGLLRALLFVVPYVEKVRLKDTRFSSHPLADFHEIHLRVETHVRDLMRDLIYQHQNLIRAIYVQNKSFEPAPQEIEENFKQLLEDPLLSAMSIGFTTDFFDEHLGADPYSPAFAIPYSSAQLFLDESVRGETAWREFMRRVVDSRALDYLPWKASKRLDYFEKALDLIDSSWELAAVDRDRYYREIGDVWRSLEYERKDWNWEVRVPFARERNAVVLEWNGSLLQYHRIPAHKDYMKSVRIENAKHFLEALKMRGVPVYLLYAKEDEAELLENFPADWKKDGLIPQEAWVSFNSDEHRDEIYGNLKAQHQTLLAFPQKAVSVATAFAEDEIVSVQYAPDQHTVLPVGFAASARDLRDAQTVLNDMQVADPRTLKLMTTGVPHFTDTFNPGKKPTKDVVAYFDQWSQAGGNLFNLSGGRVALVDAKDFDRDVKPLLIRFPDIREIIFVNQHMPQWSHFERAIQRYQKIFPQSKTRFLAFQTGFSGHSTFLMQGEVDMVIKWGDLRGKKSYSTSNYSPSKKENEIRAQLAHHLKPGGVLLQIGPVKTWPHDESLFEIVTVSLPESEFAPAHFFVKKSRSESRVDEWQPLKESLIGQINADNQPIAFWLKNVKPDSQLPQFKVQVYRTPLEGYKFEVFDEGNKRLGDGTFVYDQEEKILRVQEFFPIGQDSSSIFAQYQRQGIGSTLVAWLMTEARLAKFIFANSLDGTGNEHLIQIYKSYLDKPLETRALDRQSRISGLPKSDFESVQVVTIDNPFRSESRTKITTDDLSGWIEGLDQLMRSEQDQSLAFQQLTSQIRERLDPVEKRLFDEQANTFDHRWAGYSDVSAKEQEEFKTFLALAFAILASEQPSLSVLRKADEVIELFNLKYTNRHWGLSLTLVMQLATNHAVVGDELKKQMHLAGKGIRLPGEYKYKMAAFTLYLLGMHVKSLIVDGPFEEEKVDFFPRLSLPLVLEVLRNGIAAPDVPVQMRNGLIQNLKVGLTMYLVGTLRFWKHGSLESWMKARYSEASFESIRPLHDWIFENKSELANIANEVETLSRESDVNVIQPGIAWVFDEVLNPRDAVIGTALSWDFVLLNPFSVVAKELFLHFFLHQTAKSNFAPEVIRRALESKRKALSFNDWAEKDFASLISNLETIQLSRSENRSADSTSAQRLTPDAERAADESAQRSALSDQHSAVPFEEWLEAQMASDTQRMVELTERAQQVSPRIESFRKEGLSRWQEAIRTGKIEKTAPVIFYSQEIESQLIKFIQLTQKSFESVHSGEGLKRYRFSIVFLDEPQKEAFVAKHGKITGVKHYVLASMDFLKTDVFNSTEWKQHYGIFGFDNELNGAAWQRNLATALLPSELSFTLIPDAMAFFSVTQTDQIESTLASGLKSWIQHLEIRKNQGVFVLSTILEFFSTATRRVMTSA